MTTRKKAAEKSEAKAEEHHEPTTEEVYAGYVPGAAPDRVEVRINGKVVYLKDVYGARASELSSGGVSVKGSTEAPKPPTASTELYNPIEVESDAVRGAQVAPVPETDPEYTAALDESATPDDAE